LPGRLSGDFRATSTPGGPPGSTGARPAARLALQNQPGYSRLPALSSAPGNSRVYSRRLPEGGLAEGGFWIRLKIGRFRGLGGPGWLLNHPKRWGLRPPPLWMVLKPTGAARTPKTTDFQPNPNHPLPDPPLATADERILLDMPFVTQDRFSFGATFRLFSGWGVPGGRVFFLCHTKNFVFLHSPADSPATFGATSTPGGPLDRRGLVPQLSVHYKSAGLQRPATGACKRNDHPLSRLGA